MTSQSPAHDLRLETEAARVLLATYRDVLADDAEARHDMVEGQTDLHEAIRAGVVRIAEIDAMLAGIKGFADKLKERSGRLEQQKDLLRTAILTAMEIGALKKLETDVAIVSLKAVPPSLVVTDEAAIPSTFFVRADPRLDRKKLLDALKAEQSVPGAALSNGGVTLQIR